MNHNRRPVYSSDHGRICPDCKRPKAKCVCKRLKQEAKKVANVSKDGIVRVSRETKGRKGKGVTLIKGLGLGSAELQKLAKQLKKKCGAGGAVKDGIIEIQGDHRERLVVELTKLGYTAKSAGG